MDGLWEFVAGPRLGWGMSREVYEFHPITSMVIKVEKDSRHFQNVEEYKVWNEVKWMDQLKPWFAPCITISTCGRYLIQMRTQPIMEHQLPEKVPSFLTDLHVKNWGWFDKRPVIHDYGTSLIRNRGMSTRLKKAEWRKDSA